MMRAFRLQLPHVTVRILNSINQRTVIHGRFAASPRLPISTYSFQWSQIARAPPVSEETNRAPNINGCYLWSRSIVRSEIRYQKDCSFVTGDRAGLTLFFCFFFRLTNREISRFESILKKVGHCGRPPRKNEADFYRVPFPFFLMKWFGL